MLFHHLTRSTALCAILITLPAMTSCGEDPELLIKYEQQKAEIMGLEGELSVLREELSRAPKDRSRELEDLKKQTTDEKERIIELEESIASLGLEKKELEKELEDYKRKYPIR